MENKKKYQIFRCIIGFIFFSHQIHAQTYKPVNPRANPEVIELLNYLYSIKGKQILSGQHNYVYKAHLGKSTITWFTDTATQIIGKEPVVWGSDMSFGLSATKRQDIVDSAIAKHAQGCIVTIMYHQVRPMDLEYLPDKDGYYLWKNSLQGDITDEEWKEFLTPGTDLNTKWLQKIDTVANYLKQLQEANVPVLWRPYHEMNGDWFWWGNKTGENGYVKLWKMLYDRYVNYHQLNNLIWVWNANGPRDIEGDEAYAYADYFPGIEYVDILAADIYHNDYKQSHHDELVELGKGKIIALGEVGQLPTPEILEKQPQWVWFMCWSDYFWRKNTVEEINELFAAPKILTLDELSK